MNRPRLHTGMCVLLCTGAVFVDIGPWQGKRKFWEGTLTVPGDHPRLASKDPRKPGGRYPFSPTAVELAAPPAEFEARLLIERLTK